LSYDGADDYNEKELMFYLLTLQKNFLKDVMAMMMIITMMMIMKYRNVRRLKKNINYHQHQSQEET
jgi:hypothetical protein